MRERRCGPRPPGRGGTGRRHPERRRNPPGSLKSATAVSVSLSRRLPEMTVAEEVVNDETRVIVKAWKRI